MRCEEPSLMAYGNADQVPIPATREGVSRVRPGRCMATENMRFVFSGIQQHLAVTGFENIKRQQGLGHKVALGSVMTGTSSGNFIRLI